MHSPFTRYSLAPAVALNRSLSLSLLLSLSLSLSLARARARADVSENSPLNREPWSVSNDVSSIGRKDRFSSVVSAMERSL
jgi:hypothetical protein